MNNCVKWCIYIILCFCYSICNAQTYYYELKRKVIEGVSSTNVSGGQFISFTKDGCYESDKEGFTVNNGSLKYKYSEDGILVYSGTCYWGRGYFRFTKDKSKLNVVTDSGDIYVYSLAAAPGHQQTCSLIRKQDSSGGGRDSYNHDSGVNGGAAYPANGGMYYGGYNNANSNDGSGTQRDYHNHKCFKCKQSGTYTCPCYSVPTFGNITFHDCPNCRVKHQVGTRHSCRCNDCGGDGIK